MGGIGSGNRWNRSSRATVDQYCRIDVRRWARDGMLRPGAPFTWQWRRGGEVTNWISAKAEIGRVILDYQIRDGDERVQMRYPVYLSSTPCTLGGQRDWFLCPARGCGRRVATLFCGRLFACRQCHNLAYPCQRETPSDRAARRADRLRAKLGWEGGILNEPGPKPKGMHWRTFERMTKDHDRFAAKSCALLMAGLNPSIANELPL